MGHTLHAAGDNMITDFITGKPVRNVGPEASRQIFEKFLVTEKGWDRQDIKIDQKIVVQFKGEDYCSKIDLIVFLNDKAFMAVTCVAGSIGSYEREILAGARLVYSSRIPYAVSTDARDAVVLDSLTGRKIGEGLDAVFSKKKALEISDAVACTPFSPDRREKEMIIFRSFNLEKVNIQV